MSTRSRSMTPAQAMAFVEKHGIVLQSGKGPVPTLSEAIAGEPIKGSWWAHSMSHEIFATIQAVTDSPDVLTCRLVGGKITLVHRRLWPALARCARRFPPERIASVRQEHTSSGRHVNVETAFSKWVSAETKRIARTLDEDAALEALGAWAEDA